MPLATSDCQEPVEECIEELDELVMGFDRHPPWAVPQALGVHLEALLRAMLAAGECSARDIRHFLREIGRGALN